MTHRKSARAFWKSTKAAVCTVQLKDLIALAAFARAVIALVRDLMR
jgi:hypothetical protein